MDTGHKAILPKPVRSRKTLRISRLHIQLYVWTRSHCSTKGHLSAQENQTCLWDTASPLLTFIKQPASICWQTQERSHFCHTTNDLHPFSSAADWISTPMREPVSSTAINRDIPDLTSRRSTWYDKFLCAWKKVNSNSLFCISKYYCGSESHKQPIPYHTQIHCQYRDNIHSFISRTPWLPVHSWKDRTIIILPPDNPSAAGFRITTCHYHWAGTHYYGFYI